jgi:molybdopterin-containing oxidoreductase family iron-sulfur binding subunit
MSESTKNDRRDFLKKGAIGVTLAAWGQLIFTTSCSSGDSAEMAASETVDTVKLLTPDGQLVEVESKHLRHVHNIPAISREEARKGIPGRKFAMVIDLGRCNNARKCITACQEMHHLPEDKEWLSIKLMKDSKDTAPYWFPKTCFHCDNPPCVKVCPVNATYKRDDGLVLVDSDRCIGCKFCMTACPYSTRTFAWHEDNGVPVDMHSHSASDETSVPTKPGTVSKCDFCPDMARQGKLPDCVSACPNGVFYFGDQNEDIVTNGEETVRFSELINDRAGYRYMEDLGTEPRVWYLPPRDRMFPVERGYESLPDDLKARYKDVDLGNS